jgi:hypothetical protein
MAAWSGNEKGAAAQHMQKTQEFRGKLDEGRATRVAEPPARV